MKNFNPQDLNTFSKLSILQSEFSHTTVTSSSSPIPNKVGSCNTTTKGVDNSDESLGSSKKKVVTENTRTTSTYSKTIFQLDKIKPWGGIVKDSSTKLTPNHISLFNSGVKYSLNSTPNESGSNVANHKRLHISNIPFRFRESDLYKMFEKFGEVIDVQIIYYDKGSKGYGFVTLSKGSDADMARLVLHGSVVEGRIIEVNLATPKISPANRPSVTKQTAWAKKMPHRHREEIHFASPAVATIAMLDAQTRLAEAELAALQMQQKLMEHQYSMGLK